MDKEDVEFYLYSILSGKTYLTIDNHLYISIPNTVDEIYRANLLYRSTMDNIKYENMMTWDQAQIVSAKLGYWTHENEASLKQLETMLENTRLELFLSYVQIDKVKRLKKTIRSIENGINQSYNNKYRLYDITKESFAHNIKETYLIGLSIIDSNGDKVYNIEDFDNWDDSIINSFKNYRNANYIDIKNIRYISRVDPFRGMWINSKEKIFKTVPSEWTQNQKLLASFSRMYDNVYESMECPPDEVIKDDDMLDGWFVKQKKDREKKQKDRILDDKFGKIKNNDGQEIFVVAGRDDIQDIYNMNDNSSRNIIRSRAKQIEQNKEVKHQHLKDVQMDLHMQKTQEMRETMRRR